MNPVESADIASIPEVEALVDALQIYYYKAKRGPTFPAQPDTALYKCEFTKAEMEQMDAALAPFIESEEAIPLTKTIGSLIMNMQLRRAGMAQSTMAVTGRPT